MKIAHLAMWVKDLEAEKSFFATFFQAAPHANYHNPVKRFTSCFMSFPGSEVTLELMHHSEVPNFRERPISVNPFDQHLGMIHFAISVGSEKKVNELTHQIREAGHRVIGEPRRTGDGYYESVVLDPEGNMIEITV